VNAALVRAAGTSGDVLAKAKTGEADKAGPIGLVVILVLCIACYFLFKSMSKHLKKVRDDFPQDAGTGTGVPGGSGSPGRPVRPVRPTERSVAEANAARARARAVEPALPTASPMTSPDADVESDPPAQV
jgi:hypothetical protein